MKKMINALLAASMLASFIAVPFTVNAATTLLPVIQEEEKSVDLEAIEKMLSEYITKNNIPAIIIGVNPIYAENKVTIKYRSIEYNWKDDEVPKKILAFLAENNIDEELVNFAIEESASTEKITDLKTIEKMLSEYITKNNIPAIIIGVNPIYAENKVTIKYRSIEYNWKDDEVPKIILAFLAENNIDEESVNFAIDESNFIIIGDSNCDCQVDMADAVLIMQALANPNKYGLDGTAEVHLTEQGKANADMDGDGLTVGDAQAIQKILLGLE